MMLLLFILLCITVFVSMCLGQYHVSAKQVASILLSLTFPVHQSWTETMYRVVLYNRLPRIIAAILVGGSLSLAGAAYQGVFRNPLVSPDILGVSNGACVGAAISILLKLGYIGNVILAFLGGLLAVIISTLFPTLIQKRSTISLVLSGVIVGGFFSSILGLLKYLADADTELAEITYWQLGSLSKVKVDALLYLAPIIIISGALLVLFRWRINALSLGDAEAKSLGVNLYRERGVIIVSATLLTASSVCISGTIGWIGLVVPHFTRIIVGEDNIRVIPASFVISSIFLVTIDTLARNLTGAEIPLSIITGFIGTPFFAYVLIRQKSKS